MSFYDPPNNLYWIAGLVGFVVAALLAYPIYRLLLALKSRQTVSQYAPEGHQKKQGTPTMGGLIIVCGAITGLMYAVASEPGRIRAYDVSPLLAAAALMLGFAFIGFADDFIVPRMIAGKRGLGWKQKIVMQFVVAGLAAWLDHRSFDLVWFGGLFLILFFSNAYNFADGLDWLAGTMLLALGAGLIAVAWSARMYDAAALIGPILAAAIPFMVLNRPPAKLFMGDVGSLPIGAVIGYCVAAIAMPSLAPHMYSGNYGDHMGAPHFSDPMPTLVGVLLALSILSLMMVVELVPVPMQIAWVKLFKRRIFPYTPVHHAFEKAGWREGKVVALFFGCQLACSLLATAIAQQSVASHDASARAEAIEHLQGMR